jgi:ATP-dependent metalloprotease FtsH
MIKNKFKKNKIKIIFFIITVLIFTTFFIFNMIFVNNNIGDPTQSFGTIFSFFKPYFLSFIGHIIQLSILMVIVFVLFSYFFKGGASLFAKETKKFDKNTTPKTRFNQIAGIYKQKQEVQEIVDFLKNPNSFQEMGAVLPKGILFVGPPGTGKTLLARAIAGEAGVPFYFESASRFEEMVVGLGASRIRNLFAEANKNSPAILFIDEIDAIGSKRTSRNGANSQQSLNEILVCLDGFEEHSGLIVIAATNNKELLDPALLRSGRFDKEIVFTIPKLKERLDIFDYYTKNIPIDSTVNIDSLAKLSQGLTAADIQVICNESSIFTAVHRKKTISHEDIQRSWEKLVFGSEGSPEDFTNDHNYVVAIHEAGHALMGFFYEKETGDKIHKLTLVSRGDIGGMLMSIEDHEGKLTTKESIDAKIKVSLGGRIAEKIIFGEEKSTVGAYSDLRSIRGHLRTLLTTHLIGEDIVQSSLLDSEYNIEVWSEKSMAEREVFIKNYIDNISHETKKEMLKNKKKLLKLADELMIKKNLNRDEMIRIITEDTNNIIEIIEENVSIVEKDISSIFEIKDSSFFIEENKDI